MSRQWWDQKGIDWKTVKTQAAEKDSESASEMESNAEEELQAEPKKKE